MAAAPPKQKKPKQKLQRLRYSKSNGIQELARQLDQRSLDSFSARQFLQWLENGYDTPDYIRQTFKSFLGSPDESTLSKLFWELKQLEAEDAEDLLAKGGVHGSGVSNLGAFKDLFIDQVSQLAEENSDLYRKLIDPNDEGTEVDWRPEETIPEDYYAMGRTGQPLRYEEEHPRSKLNRWLSEQFFRLKNLTTRDENPDDYQLWQDLRDLAYIGASKPVKGLVEVADAAYYAGDLSSDGGLFTLQQLMKGMDNPDLEGAYSDRLKQYLNGLAEHSLENFPGAFTGSFDWRPNETIPEDYYAMSRPMRFSGESSRQVIADFIRRKLKRSGMDRTILKILNGSQYSLDEVEEELLPRVLEGDFKAVDGLRKHYHSLFDNDGGYYGLLVDDIANNHFDELMEAYPPQKSVDWRPEETIPEDFYAMARTRQGPGLPVVGQSYEQALHYAFDRGEKFAPENPLTTKLEDKFYGPQRMFEEPGQQPRVSQHQEYNEDYINEQFKKLLRGDIENYDWMGAQLRSSLREAAKASEYPRGEEWIANVAKAALNGDYSAYLQYIDAFLDSDEAQMHSSLSSDDILRHYDLIRPAFIDSILSTAEESEDGLGYEGVRRQVADERRRRNRLPDPEPYEHPGLDELSQEENMVGPVPSPAVPGHHTTREDESDPKWTRDYRVARGLAQHGSTFQNPPPYDASQERPMQNSRRPLRYYLYDDEGFDDELYNYAVDVLRRNPGYTRQKLGDHWFKDDPAVRPDRNINSNRAANAVGSVFDKAWADWLDEVAELEAYDEDDVYGLAEEQEYGDEDYDDDGIEFEDNEEEELDDTNNPARGAPDIPEVEPAEGLLDDDELNTKRINRQQSWFIRDAVENGMSAGEIALELGKPIQQIETFLRRNKLPLTPDLSDEERSQEAYVNDLEMAARRPWDQPRGISDEDEKEFTKLMGHVLETEKNEHAQRTRLPVSTHEVNRSPRFGDQSDRDFGDYLNRVSHGRQEINDPETLSEIQGLIGQGWSARAIAVELGLGLSSVKKAMHQLQAQEEDEEPIRQSRRRSPSGGLIHRGIYYPGGYYLPTRGYHPQTIPQPRAAGPYSELQQTQLQ